MERDLRAKLPGVAFKGTSIATKRLDIGGIEKVRPEDEAYGLSAARCFSGRTVSP